MIPTLHSLSHGFLFLHRPLFDWVTHGCSGNIVDILTIYRRADFSAHNGMPTLKLLQLNFIKDLLA